MGVQWSTTIIGRVGSAEFGREGIFRRALRRVAIFRVELGTVFWQHVRGDFTNIEALPAPRDRVAGRMYDTATEIWDHPFEGVWADLAVAVQTAPFQGKDLSSVLRSYTVNGLKFRPYMAFLAPDCFAHTIFSVDTVVSLVRAHGERQRDRNGELGMAMGDPSDGLIVEEPVVLTASNVFKSKLYID